MTVDCVMQCVCVWPTGLMVFVDRGANELYITKRRKKEKQVFSRKQSRFLKANKVQGWKKFKVPLRYCVHFDVNIGSNCLLYVKFVSAAGIDRCA